MASDRVMIFGFGMALALLVFVLELVRRRRLREELALLWLATALVVMVLSISRTALNRLSQLLGIFTPTSALLPGRHPLRALHAPARLHAALAAHAG